METKALGIVVFLIIALLASGIHAQEQSDNKTVSFESKVQKLAGDFQFTEGPAADKEGNIYFTDIPNSRIHKWSVDGKLSTFMENSDGANGLFFDKKGNLITTQVK